MTEVLGPWYIRALPHGGGEVTFTYLVTNSGAVALEAVEVGDDLCSPVTYVSGDTGGDGILDPAEAWTYHCTTTVSETQTNTATVSACPGAGANNVPNVKPEGCTSSPEGCGVVPTGSPFTSCVEDTDQATVVVSELAIAIDKTASSESLAFGGGQVTFTYTVTNPGLHDLDTIEVTDDMCSPVTYVSGDTGDDGVLGMDETWSYTCVKTLTASETNTATASGCEAKPGNGPARDAECVEDTD